MVMWFSFEFARTFDLLCALFFLNGKVMPFD